MITLRSVLTAGQLPVVPLVLPPVLPVGRLIAVFVMFSGCASVPSPVQELEVATAALQTARSNGAPQFASQQWVVAQDKLARANQMLEQKQNAAARRALEQVTSDARLAVAVAQLQMRVSEQHALQKEIDHLQKRIEEVELSPREPAQEWMIQEQSSLFSICYGH